MRSRIYVAVVAAMLVLLPGLAVVQYRWIGRVSEAERARMLATVRAATLRFAQDFNQEIARSLNDGGRAVRKLYVARRAPGAALQLTVLDRDTGRFQPVEWPIQFAELQARLLERPRPGRPPIPPPMEESSALVVLPRGAGRGPNRGQGRRRPRPTDGWTIAQLDLDYIRDDLIPAMTQKHFAEAGYQMIVLSRGEPPELVYRSDPSLTPPDFIQADATAPLVDLRPEPPPNGRVRPPLPPDSRGRWLLLVKHRAGSLEAAVTHARRRNLAVSFAILLLLVASTAMLLITTRRAQRLARQQMEFVAGVSHELRTPLAVICSAGDNLADGVATGEQQVRRYGSVIRTEGRRLTEMVEQTLGFAAAQSGRMRLDLQPVNVRQVIDRALAACEPEIRETGCDIEEHLGDNLPPVQADARALALCVRNLVSNALKHGDGHWVGIDAERSDRQVCISVTDRGPGIESSDLPHIFEPFFRGRKATAAQVHGSGLGLSLVERIMRAHQGAVEVSSKPGQGSRFTLRLPLHGGVTA